MDSLFLGIGIFFVILYEMISAIRADNIFRIIGIVKIYLFSAFRAESNINFVVLFFILVFPFVVEVVLIFVFPLIVVVIIVFVVIVEMMVMMRMMVRMAVAAGLIFIIFIEIIYKFLNGTEIFVEFIEIIKSCVHIISQRLNTGCELFAEIDKSADDLAFTGICIEIQSFNQPFDICYFFFWFHD